MNNPIAQSFYRLPLAAATSGLVIFLDQITKQLARSHMMAGEHLSCCSGSLQFILIENHGGFLSLFSEFSDSLRFVFLTIFVGFLLVAGSYYLARRVANVWLTLSLAAVIGGGTSNLLDRIVNHGGVTDFLLIQIFDMHTGIFNLADVFIVLGGMLSGFLYFSGRNH